MTPDQCVILAGGLGTRLLPRTETIPKTMLVVAGRPFAYWQLSWLADQGIQRVVYCIGHLGELVQDFVGDGSQWGVSVSYVRDPVPLRGTAGAIRLALDQHVLDPAFFVLYGDSYLSVDMIDVAREFAGYDQPALMTVFRNDGEWDRSNVILDGDSVALYDKHPDPVTADDMDHIDYGLLVLTSETIRERVPSGQVADLAPMLNSLSRDRLLAAYEVSNRFYEIGSEEGIADLEQILAGRR